MRFYNLPRDAATAFRIFFIVNEDSLDLLTEVLFRFVSPYAVTMEEISDDEIQVSCFITKSEFALIRHWLGSSLRSKKEKEDAEIEKFRIFLEHIDEGAT